MRAATALNRSLHTRLNDSFGQVVSSQTSVHPRLEQTVRRHFASRWQQPLHPPTIAMYKRLVAEFDLGADTGFILDSGCGTGKSTQYLARLFPQQLVIGVDRSEKRLAKNGTGVGFERNANCILLRAELATFWRLLGRDDHRPERHFLLYPNPWPKARHLRRRWHGHPVFPRLLSLGGILELRCNWAIYADEFVQAVNMVALEKIRVKPLTLDKAISPFEQKYLDRGHALFSVVVPYSHDGAEGDPPNPVG